MKKLNLTVLFVFLFADIAFSQENAEKPEFKPSGKPYAMVFSNFHFLSQDEKYDYAFEITRAYLGYGYNFSEHFSGKVNIDVGMPEVNIGDSLEGSTNLQLTAYLKTAALTYKYEKLSVDFGLVGLMQFKLQESIWGHRYLYKSFQDAYKFGSSADLGIVINYDILDELSVDVSAMNGEGYKSLQADSIFKYGLGITGKPLEGFVIRGYYDLMGADVFQSTIAGFVGYESEKVNAGVEYNMQTGNKIKDKHDFSGFSVYGSFQATKMIEAFARYDNLSSVKLEGEDDPWNIKKDGQAIIGGIEFSLVKGIKIAPNYQGWIPEKDGVKPISSFFINIEMKL